MSCLGQNPGLLVLTIAAEILATNDTDADDLTLTIDNVGNALHGTVSMDDVVLSCLRRT